MKKRRLGKSDIEITPIGLGCWQFSQGKGFAGRFWDSLDQGTMTSVVKAALDGGISWFDTAEIYGEGQSERALRSALRELHVTPGSVVIATKWKPFFRTAGSIRRTIGERIAALLGYPIDLHQIHFPASFSSIPAQMREMAGLAREGLIRSVGVSNFSARQMEIASAALEREGLPLVSNQVRISLLDRKIENNGVLAAARSLGVTLIAYSPLAQGILTGRFHDNPELASRLKWMRRNRSYLPEGLARTVPLIEELRAIARAHGATSAEVALAWLIGFYGDTVVAIPGASKPRQAEEAAAAIELRLTERELSRLDELSRAVGTGHLASVAPSESEHAV